MRFIARHRKIINMFVVFVCLIVFLYLVILTKNIKDINVDCFTYSGIAMGTAIKKSIYAENVKQSEEVDAIIDDCLRELENQISVRVTDSEISIMNRSYASGGVFPLSPNIVRYLKEEMQLCQETNGAFVPCIRPLSELWGIEEGTETVPDDAAISELLPYISPVNLEVVDNGVIFHKDSMMIDFGATGKGIACDEIKKKLEKTGVQGAVVSIGGSILAYGDKGDGKDWHIGIQNPRAEEGNVLGVVNIGVDSVISTSGDYEKYFEQDGKRYHHIFDPATGYPTDNGLISVTIISENGLMSDALSTGCFVMGLDDGLKYAEEKGVGAIFVTSDKKVYVTSNLKKTFRLQSEEYELVE